MGSRGIYTTSGDASTADRLQVLLEGFVLRWEDQP
jgi:hypothetical protein